MKKMLVSVFCLVSYCGYSQIDTAPTKSSPIIDSLSKAHDKTVIGYTKIGGKITHIKYIKNNKQYELSLVGFQLETLSPQAPLRTTNRTVYSYGNR